MICVLNREEKILEPRHRGTTSYFFFFGTKDLLQHFSTSLSQTQIINLNYTMLKENWPF